MSTNEATHSAEAITYVYTLQELIKQGELPDSSQLQNVLSYIYQNVFHEKKLTANIDPILEKLTAGSLAKILVPDYDNLDSDRDILEMRQLLTEGGNVYFGMNALGDMTVSSAFLQIVLEDLNSQFGQFYQYGSDYGRMSSKNDGRTFLKREVAIHIDELSAVRTKAVRNLLARSGELGVLLRLYTQSHADMVLTMGSEYEAETAD